ncbi:GAF and ANTAR domain-containing protein [Nakamurella deserti]|uniref:GAF and ANTAR domain-containing protein n=1 Tax=Nakamurella deserti TaxID=2164074 RepID=UPI000DBE94DE|nr:GAF and ANTAR domain-containing protein [Nakamurella deserti]
MPVSDEIRAPGISLPAALRELSAVLTSTESFHELIQRIAELAARTVPTALTCGITVATDGRVVTVGAADALAAQLDEQQYRLEAGPCLEALWTGRVVDVPDLSREQRWDGYPVQAMAQGISAVYASPLRVRDDTVGALNLYAARPYAFDDDDQRASIQQLADLTTVAITGSLRNYGDARLSDQLQTALNSRAVIDQAIGIVMATRHCSAEEAFATLRTISQTRNVRLAVIAAGLVERTAGGPGGGRPAR